MTVVEFFDTNAVENIVSALLCAPERVVLVGDNHKRMAKAKVRYEEIAAAHQLQVTFSYESVNRNDLQDIIKKLETIIAKYGECTFDLTGGEDLYLVAVGAVFCAHRDKVQLHRFNIRNGRLYDCDADGQILAVKQASLTIEENVKAYGGRVIFEAEKENTTYRWDFNQAFCADLDRMWRICKKNYAQWNDAVHALDGFHTCCVQDKTALSVFIEPEQVKDVLLQRGYPAFFSGSFFKELETYDLIHSLTFSTAGIAFTYKNEQVKRCLTNAGRVLELFVTQTARTLTDQDGKPLFDDVMTGVTIDWDGKLEADKQEVNNEMDVMLMKDLTPIFISCKNGRNFKSDELYKLSTVAERFGGQYAKKVLVATRLDEMRESGEAIVNRAAEMGITVIKIKNDDLCEQRFTEMLRKLGG
ncbi:MAG: DUF1887 family protein [Clostridia bacterium]|nr:DUF1887 family protein [Clostridia bacterium]